MHPPPFSLDHRLSDWPDYALEMQCCKGTVVYPVKLFIAQHGDRAFGRLLACLRCSECGKPPAPVYLCAGRRQKLGGGAPADWAIELVPGDGDPEL